MRRLAGFSAVEWARYHEEHRRKARIWNRASKAVREALATGVLIKATACERCGIEGKKIEAAHSDYARPLDIRWLCQSCHRKWDSAEPKTPADDLAPRQRLTYVAYYDAQLVSKAPA